VIGPTHGSIDTLFAVTPESEKPPKEVTVNVTSWPAVTSAWSTLME
jgi:hypothetical protein